MNDQGIGELAYVFLVSILDAVLLSVVALAWYRRSVKRLMRERARQTESGATFLASPRTSPPLPDAATSPLAFAFFDGSRDPNPMEPPPPVNLKRLIAAYCLGAALHSAVITAVAFRSEGGHLPLTAWFAEWWVNTWPIVPTLAVLLVRDRASSIRLASTYVLGGAVAVALVTLAGQITRGSFNSAPLTNIYWAVSALAVTATVPLLLIWLTGWRRIRAVAPMAFASTLVFGFGSLAFRELLIRALDVARFRSTFLAVAAATSTNFAHYGLFMLASLPVGWIAWQLVRWLGGAYTRRRFSDVQLTIDCWWIVVTADEIATSLTGERIVIGAAVGVLAFAVYRAAVAIVLRWRRQDVFARAGNRLLLLRVFGYEARTESLFDRVAQRWRFHGPVQLIAGEDLATRTIDPDDVLGFLSGRLDARYVATLEEVPQRIAQLDLARDPDGRHRVNELYCHDDTWRAVLQSLLDLSDMVLMDLRSFSAQNSGCVFELHQLLRRVQSDRIVLVCDNTTDLPLLGRILSEAWSAAVADLCARGSGEIAIVQLKTGKRRELAVLMQRLLGTAKPQRLFQAAELPAALA